MLDTKKGNLLEASGISLSAPGGRPLVRELDLAIADEHVALLGRNGAGKSTLLALLAGEYPGRYGGRVYRRTRPFLVPQDLTPYRSRGRGSVATDELERECRLAGLPSFDPLASSSVSSGGERRKIALIDAKLSGADLLLLDEPTRDLDERGRRWLLDWLVSWRGGLVVASHDRGLLRCFRHFFVMQESGCQYFPGSLDDLEEELTRQEQLAERKYLASLQAVERREQHAARVRRRRQRKKNLGRIHEEGRSPSKAQLCEKKSFAQVSQGREAKLRDQRSAAVRAWAKRARRAMSVSLPLELTVPDLDESSFERDSIRLKNVGMTFDGRQLFDGLDLRLSPRFRLGISGPNGSGKSTLVEIMMGSISPTSGSAHRELGALGFIGQGSRSPWRSDESLLSHLGRSIEPDRLAQVLLAHKFPLALAERPMWSLSPGERMRAALIALLLRSPAPAMLILDEPSDGLDFMAARSLRMAIRQWPGGLVLVSHDEELLESAGVEQTLHLNGAGGYEIRTG